MFRNDLEERSIQKSIHLNKTQFEQKRFNIKMPRKTTFSHSTVYHMTNIEKDLEEKSILSKLLMSQLKHQLSMGVVNKVL